MFNKLLVLSIVIFSYANIFADYGLFKNQVFYSNGDKRSYDLYLPKNNSNALKPMVLLLHGHFGSADVVTGENNKKAPFKVWLDIADREGLVLLIPDGEKGSDNQRGWNDCRANTTTNPETNDVLFLNSLVRTISAKYPIDKNRIYVNGISNGGMMAYRLAVESGLKYKAIAAIVASMPEINECMDSHVPISVMIMNGTRDPLVPYRGGKIGRKRDQDRGRGSVASTRESVNYWVNNNGIRNPPTVTNLPNRVRRDRSTIRVEHYSGGLNKSEVVLYKVIGGGHTEPSYSEQYSRLYKIIVGNQNKDIEMAEDVWGFFNNNK